MNDDIVKSESRMIAAVMEPEAAAAGLMLKEMRSPEKTLDYFVSWAHWGWLDTAKAHLQLFHDTRTLDRIGFCMAWDVETDQGELDWEEASASKLWSFLRSVLKYRAGSNLWHTWGPGASAGLLCQDEEGRKAALKWHRDLFEAVAAVKQHGSHGAQALIKDTMCNEILQRYIFQSLRAANFLEVPAALSRFLHKIWSGLLNSKLLKMPTNFRGSTKTGATTPRNTSRSDRSLLLWCKKVAVPQPSTKLHETTLALTVCCVLGQTLLVPILTNQV